MELSNKTYDILKKIALMVAPITVFISAILSIWGVTHAEQITATLAAFDTLIGTIIAIISHQYNKPLDVDVEGLQYLEDEEIKGEEVDE